MHRVAGAAAGAASNGARTPGRALEQARDDAGDESVSVGGGARVVQQFLAAGPVDEMQIHVSPVLLGDGMRQFEQLGAAVPRLEAHSLENSGITPAHRRQGR